MDQLGDLWVDTDNPPIIFVFPVRLVPIGPEFSDGLATGVTPANIIGTDNVFHSYTT